MAKLTKTNVKGEYGYTYQYVITDKDGSVLYEGDSEVKARATLKEAKELENKKDEEEKKEEQKEEKKEESKKESQKPEDVQIKDDTPDTEGLHFGDENYTDPIVIFDPTKSVKGILTPYISHSHKNEKTPEGLDASMNNSNDCLRLDGIEYPLLVINNRNISNYDIIYMKLSFTDFLPELVVRIHDEHQQEQKLATSQMSGSVRLIITSAIDKVYKKIKLHFRIYNVKISPYDHRDVTYYCTYDADKLRQVNTGLIYKDDLKATTYEMLYKIAENCGLGFAATKMTKNVEDRIYRNIFTQRYDEYIQQQLKHAGVDEDSVLDAWIDPYNYITLVNVSWVFSEDVSVNDLSIVANVGYHGTNWDAPEAKPIKSLRILTDFNNEPTANNLFINTYRMIVDNNAIFRGTLERIYNIDWDDNVTKLDTNDIQTQQDSVDGKYLEEYNTGHNRPIPKFNFNEDGYNLNTQKIIRQHFFNKKRQSVLKVVLKNVNLGLQRGTLVGVSIWELDAWNKEVMLSQTENLGGDMEMQRKDMNYSKSSSLPDDEVVTLEDAALPNMKLSDLYYIDGIEFEYSKENRIIEQSLYLIKKGAGSGYNNTHSMPKIDDKNNQKMK